MKRIARTYTHVKRKGKELVNVDVREVVAKGSKDSQKDTIWPTSPDGSEYQQRLL